MNIDTERTKEMLDLFLGLNEKYQKEAMIYAFNLSLYQKAEKEVLKETLESGEELDERKKEHLIKLKKTEDAKDLLNILDMMKELSKEGAATELASLGIMIDKLSKGKFSKRDEISITINSKQIDLDEYLKTMLPKANMKEARTMVDEFFTESGQ